MTSPSETPVTVINITRTLAIRLTFYGTGLLALGLAIVAVLFGRGEHNLQPAGPWLLS